MEKLLAIIPVILSGGTGTRLWPQSRQNYPKQFISFNSKYTLLQETLLRLNGIPNIQNPIVVANFEHRFIVLEQLREIGYTNAKVLLEPFGRNTAPAISLAALYAQANFNDNSQLLILPSDHLIKDVEEFHKAIILATKAEKNGHFVTFGITPTCPETGYGYIKKGKNLTKDYFKVDKFTEKPSFTIANKYIKSKNYYWNAGMFLFSTNLFLEQIKKLEPELIKNCNKSLNFADLDSNYIKINQKFFYECPSISIDYALMEKTSKTAMVELNAGWSDIGSWESMWKVSDKNKDYNVIAGNVVSIDTTNCYIRSENKLIATIGVNDLIISESDDSILIANKSASQTVKNIVERLMHEKRSEAVMHRKRFFSWGSSEIIDKKDTFEVVRITIKDNNSITLSQHFYNIQYFIIIEGNAKICTKDDFIYLKENQKFDINTDSIYKIENNGCDDLVLIKVQKNKKLNTIDKPSANLIRDKNISRTTIYK